MIYIKNDVYLSIAGARRLFAIAPDQIYEHPPGLPIASDEIDEGQIDGYETYAFDFDGDGTMVVGPFDPVVIRDANTGIPFIRISRPGRANADFWYGPGAGGVGRFDRPCWYQSQTTLRFVAKRPG